jgi:hypothetical protein
MKGQKAQPIKPRRLHRSDAKVVTTERKIEDEYGLPSGSVWLHDPDGGRARSNKRIKRLCRDWDRWEGAKR